MSGKMQSRTFRAFVSLFRTPLTVADPGQNRPGNDVRVRPLARYSRTNPTWRQATHRCMPLLLMAACSLDNTDRRVSVRSVQVEFSMVGDSFDLAPNVPGTPTRVTLSVTREQRWLDDVPVIDPQPLGRGVVRATSPGIAIVEATAPGAASLSIRVSVMPATPVVIGLAAGSVVEPGATVRLRGYRLREAPGTGLVESVPVQILPRDSANADLILPAPLPLLSARECGAEERYSIQMIGVATAPGAVLRRRGAETTLPVGGWRRLEPFEAQCLRFPAESARYVLAWVDPLGLIDSGAGRTTGYDPVPGTYDIVVRSASGGGTSQTAPATRPRVESLHLAGAGRPPSGAVRWQNDLGSTWFEAGNPISPPAVQPYRDRDVFAVADTLTVTPEVLGGEAFPATVAATYGTYLAFIIPTATDPTVRAEFLRAIDRIGPALMTRYIPLLRRALVDRPLGTRAGWLPVVVTSLATSHDGTHRVAVGTYPTDHLELGLLEGDRFATGAAGQNLLMNALALAIAGLWMTSANGFSVSLPFPLDTYRLQDWGWSGVRNFLAVEAARLAHGVPFSGNYEIWNADFSTPFASFALGEQLGGGLFSRGAAQGNSGLVRDIVWRLMTEAGLTYEAALRLVAESAPFGFFGCYRSSCRPEGGLVERVRSVVGVSWDPASELIRMVLAQAADDLTDTPALQNPTLREAASRNLGGDPFHPTYGWPGGFGLLAQPGAAAERTGLDRGSAGFATLEIGSGGGVFATTATAPVLWGLARVR